MCDMEDGADSHLLQAALSDEFPDHYFGYVRLFSMRGVESQLGLRLPMVTDTEDDLPYLEVGKAALVAFLWNVVGERVPSPRDADFVTFLVRVRIIIPKTGGILTPRIRPFPERVGLVEYCPGKGPSTWVPDTPSEASLA